MANTLQTPLPDIMDMIDNKQLYKIRQCLKNPDYDVNEALQDGETPLMRAVSCASQSEADDVYLQFLRSLVRHPQIDINFQTKKKRTALHVACGRSPQAGSSGDRKATSSKVVEILLNDERSDVNVKGHDEATPLICALQQVTSSDDVAIVELLLGHPKCDVNAVDNNGKTALTDACESSNPSAHLALKLLLNHPRQHVNSFTDNDESPLLCAARLGHHDVVEVLLQHNSDRTAAVTDCTSDNQALNAKKRRLCTEAVAQTFNERLDINVQSQRDGFTPLTIAADNVRHAGDKYAKTIEVLMKNTDIDTCSLTTSRSSAVDVYLEQRNIDQPSSPYRCVAFDGIADQGRSILTLLAGNEQQNAKNCHSIAQAVNYRPLEICQILLEAGFRADSGMPSDKCVSTIYSLLDNFVEYGQESALHCAVALNSL